MTGFVILLIYVSSACPCFIGICSRSDICYSKLLNCQMIINTVFFSTFSGYTIQGWQKCLSLAQGVCIGVKECVEDFLKELNMYVLALFFMISVQLSIATNCWVHFNILSLAMAYPNSKAILLILFISNNASKENNSNHVDILNWSRKYLPFSGC